MSIRIMNSEYGKNFAAIIPAANEIIMIHTDPFLPHPHLLTLATALTYNSLAFSPLYTKRGVCVTLFLFPFFYIFCFVIIFVKYISIYSSADARYLCFTGILPAHTKVRPESFL